ncbi:MAG: ABC transporter ATP-binding protein [Acidimicrobiales bacterium]|jgi:ABC-2 type transport system ATP-binding protein
MSTPPPPPTGLPGPPAATPMPPPPLAGQVPTDGAPLPVPEGALVVVDRVSKWFGDLVAVSDVSFAVTAGVTALLGPNGAGKSTVLRMLCGLALPSSGTVTVMGKSPRKDPEIAAEIGLAPQQEAVFGHSTALQFVRASAELQGVVNAETEARRVLALVELDADDTRRLPTYSKGMRQRVKLAQAIVHEPRVILLDEPLSGLDPRQRLHMVELFHRLGDEGRAVIVSSHVLEEVERFGSNVVVITQGRLAAQGDFREIRALMDNRPRRLRITSDVPRSLAAALVGQPNVQGVRFDGQQIEVDTSDITSFAQMIAPLSKAADARLFEVKPLDDDLESVFRYLVGR